MKLGIKVALRLILLFDPGRAILPSRPQISRAVVSSTSHFPFPYSLQRAGTGTGKQLSLAAPGASPDLHPRSSPCLSILWFGPCGAFFRPGRLIQQPARAAAVKDGRHADLTARLRRFQAIP
jgi:hypothetical protein